MDNIQNLINRKSIEDVQYEIEKKSEKKINIYLKKRTE